MWTLEALCIVLTVGRYYIRYKVRHRFYPDDYLHLAALIWLTISNAFVEAMFPPARILFDGPPGVKPPTSEVDKFRKLQTVMSITFYISQFCVKFSFLLFYRELFWVSQRFMRAWWVVATFVFLAFWAIMAGSLTQCGPVSHIVDACKFLSILTGITVSRNSASCAAHKQYQHDARIYMSVMNVTTDFAIIIFPMFMLPKLNVRLSQKIGLALLFSMGYVTIALEIARVTWAIKGGLIANNAFYGVLSACFAVIVSCVPTYRSLFGIERKTKGDRYAHWDMSEENTRRGIDSANLTAPQGSLHGGSGSIRSYWTGKSRETEKSGTSYDFLTVPCPAFRVASL